MIIVLAVHGMSPKDFPATEKKEYFKLHSQVDHLNPDPTNPAQARHDELEAKMRAWPRTAENDPFSTASYAIAKELEAETGSSVIVGFNEFCSPTVDEAIDQAATQDNEVVVITPMLTRGGNHAEEEIPEIIERAKARHPGSTITYAFPIDAKETAKFLGAQVKALA